MPSDVADEDAEAGAGSSSSEDESIWIGVLIDDMKKYSVRRYECRLYLAKERDST